MVAIDVSNAKALGDLQAKLHLRNVEEVFFEAGRATCKTYSRASALSAYQAFNATGRVKLPTNVYLLCINNGIFPIVSI